MSILGSLIRRLANRCAETSMSEVLILRGRGGTYLGDGRRMIVGFGELSRCKAAMRCLVSGVSEIGCNFGR